MIDHNGIDPDDAFSTIPYEKGFHFIWYLDRLVGRENFDKFIPFYFSTWATKSLDSNEFKATFLKFFSQPEYDSLAGKIASINWEDRFYSRGLPPKPEFDTSLVDVCYDLAKKWEQKDFTPSPSDIESWTGNQVLVFLNTLQSREEPLSVEQSVRFSLLFLQVDPCSHNRSANWARYTTLKQARTSSSRRRITKLRCAQRMPMSTKTWPTSSVKSAE